MGNIFVRTPHTGIFQSKVRNVCMLAVLGENALSAMLLGVAGKSVLAGKVMGDIASCSRAPPGRHFGENF